MNTFSELNLVAALFALLLAGAFFWVSNIIIIRRRSVMSGVSHLLLGTLMATSAGVFYFDIRDMVVLEMLVFNSVLLSFICGYLELRNNI